MEEILETKGKIRKFITETFLFDAGDVSIGDDESLLDSGVIDSTGVLELVAYIESEFNIEVKDDELIPENFDSMTKIVHYLKMKNNL